MHHAERVIGVTLLTQSGLCDTATVYLHLNEKTSHMYLNQRVIQGYHPTATMLDELLTPNYLGITSSPVLHVQ